MKAFALIIASGVLTVTTANLLTDYLSNNQGHLNANDQFALFIIGLFAGVFSAHKLELLD